MSRKKEVLYEPNLRNIRESIVTKILNVDEHDRYRFYRLKEDLMSIDWRLNNYGLIADILNNEDLSMTRYFKSYKNLNFTLLFFMLNILSLFHFVFIIRLYDQTPSILNSISLFSIPFLLIVLVNEYSMMKICKLFPKIFEDILKKDLRFFFSDYKFHYLIHLYDAKVFREFILMRENWKENQIPRKIIPYAPIPILIYFFPKNILLDLFIGINFVLIAHSLYRSKVGAYLSLNVNKIFTSLIKFNFKASDGICGVENLYKIFNYSMFSLFLQLFTLIILKLLYASFSNDQVMSEIIKWAMFLLIMAVSLPIAFSGIKALVKGIYLNISLKKKQAFIKKRLRKKLNKFPDRQDLLTYLNLISLININQLDSFKKKISSLIMIILFIIPLAITVWASAYPVEIRKYFDILWNNYIK